MASSLILVYIRRLEEELASSLSSIASSTPSYPKIFQVSGKRRHEFELDRIGQAENIILKLALKKASFKEV